MAHNTDPGLTLARPDQPSLTAPSVGGSFDAVRTLPFGDPDQHLFGGAALYSAMPHRSDSGYEGRHRAAD
ncbi:hypothetical protein BH09ACT7_BH09ACT7_00050 [soil metagenome]